MAIGRSPQCVLPVVPVHRSLLRARSANALTTDDRVSLHESGTIPARPGLHLVLSPVSVGVVTVVRSPAAVMPVARESHVRVVAAVGSASATIMLATVISTASAVASTASILVALVAAGSAAIVAKASVVAATNEATATNTVIAPRHRRATPAAASPATSPANRLLTTPTNVTPKVTRRQVVAVAVEVSSTPQGTITTSITTVKSSWFGHVQVGHNDNVMAIDAMTSHRVAARASKTVQVRIAGARPYPRSDAPVDTGRSRMKGANSRQEGKAVHVPNNGAHAEVAGGGIPHVSAGGNAR